jgi:hypothetical protein
MQQLSVSSGKVEHAAELTALGFCGDETFSNPGALGQLSLNKVRPSAADRAFADSGRRRHHRASQFGKEARNCTIYVLDPFGNQHLGRFTVPSRTVWFTVSLLL